MSDFPSDLRYTKDHEWARVNGREITVGITAFAVEQLGDVTLVSLSAKVGAALRQGKDFGVVESVKTVSDLYAPVSGTVARVNDALSQRPELVNESPYEGAWMVVLTADDPAEVDGLMDAAAYADYVKNH